MSFSPATDFLALLRQTGGGVRTVRTPGLDYVVAALARAGVIALSVSATAPIANQAATAWFKPAIPSWAAEGTLFLWNVVTAQYEVATPALWGALLIAAATQGITQDVTAAGPVSVLPNASVVRVQNVGAPVALVMPLSANKVGGVLISDWANHAGANNISVALSGGDVFPLGAATWTIGADAGSIFLRPVPGGYAL